jgi:hypothetical protein
MQSRRAQKVGVIRPMNRPTTEILDNFQRLLFPQVELLQSDGVELDENLGAERARGFRAEPGDQGVCGLMLAARSTIVSVHEDVVSMNSSGITYSAPRFHRVSR